MSPCPHEGHAAADARAPYRGPGPGAGLVRFGCRSGDECEPPKLGRRHGSGSRTLERRLSHGTSQPPFPPSITRSVRACPVDDSRGRRGVRLALLGHEYEAAVDIEEALGRGTQCRAGPMLGARAQSGRHRRPARPSSWRGGVSRAHQAHRRPPPRCVDGQRRGPDHRLRGRLRAAGAVMGARRGIGVRLRR